MASRMDEHYDMEPLRGHKSEPPKYSKRQEERSRCYRCLNIFLICVNVLILLCGLGAIGMGVWTFLLQITGIEIFVSTSHFQFASYLTIAGGGWLFILSIGGFIPKLRHNRIFLIIYMLCLIIAAGILVAGAVLSFNFNKEPIGIETSGLLKSQIISSYGVDEEFTNTWDSVQRTVECCGHSGDINSTTSWALYKLNSEWYIAQATRIPYVPESCCSGSTDICQGNTRINGLPTFGPPMRDTFEPNAYLYTEGCFDKTKIFLEFWSFYLAITAFAIAGVAVLGLLFSCCFCVQVWRR